MYNFSIFITLGKLIASIINNEDIERFELESYFDFFYSKFEEFEDKLQQHRSANHGDIWEKRRKGIIVFIIFIILLLFSFFNL